MTAVVARYIVEGEARPPAKSAGSFGAVAVNCRDLGTKLIARYSSGIEVSA